MHTAQPHTEPSDEALMLDFANGDVKAFECLYERHALGSWRFILRSVRVQALADDLAQEVWFAVARKAASYEPRAKFRTWLFTIAHNAVVDHFRAARHAVTLDTPADAEEALDHARELHANSGFGPLRRLESKEQAMAFLAAIEQLPDEQRDAFLLQAEAGMDVSEIAAATAVSFETAKSRLRYARKRLRELLQEFA